MGKKKEPSRPTPRVGHTDDPMLESPQPGAGTSVSRSFPAGTCVVLDTNVLMADPHFGGAEFQVFLDGLSRTGIVWCLPQVVIDEAPNTLMHLTEDVLEKARGPVRRLAHLTGEAMLLPDSESIATKSQRYRSELERHSSAAYGRLVPYPQVTHAEVVKRIGERRCPFHRKEEYRDYLLWLSVQTLVLEGTATAFVTANDSDFLDGAGLHADLLADLDALLLERHEAMWASCPQFAGPPPSAADRAPVVFQTLRAFNEAAILPSLSQLDDVRRELNEGTHPVNVVDVIQDSATSLIQDEELKAIILGWPKKCGHASAIRAEVEDFEVGAVRRLTSGDILVSVLATVRLDYRVEFDEDDFLRFPEFRAWLGEPYHLEGASGGESEESIQLLLDCVITSTGTVRGVSLVQANGPEGLISGEAASR
jgi:hypothetical protein